MLTKKQNLNISITLSLYAAIELYLLQIKDDGKYKRENKRMLNNTIKQLSFLTNSIYKIIIVGTGDDYEENTGEIIQIMNSVLISDELRAYYAFQLAKKMDKEIGCVLSKKIRNNYINEIVTAINKSLDKLFDNIVAEHNRNIDLNLFENKIVEIFVD